MKHILPNGSAKLLIDRILIVFFIIVAYGGTIFCGHLFAAPPALTIKQVSPKATDFTGGWRNANPCGMAREIVVYAVESSSFTDANVQVRWTFPPGWPTPAFRSPAGTTRQDTALVETAPNIEDGEIIAMQTVPNIVTGGVDTLGFGVFKVTVAKKPAAGPEKYTIKTPFVVCDGRDNVFSVARDTVVVGYDCNCAVRYKWDFYKVDGTYLGSQVPPTPAFIYDKITKTISSDIGKITVQPFTCESDGANPLGWIAESEKVSVDLYKVTDSLIDSSYTIKTLKYITPPSPGLPYWDVTGSPEPVCAYYNAGLVTRQGVVGAHKNADGILRLQYGVENIQGVRYKWEAIPDNPLDSVVQIKDYSVGPESDQQFGTDSFRTAFKIYAHGGVTFKVQAICDSCKKGDGTLFRGPVKTIHLDILDSVVTIAQENWTGRVTSVQPSCEKSDVDFDIIPLNGEVFLNYNIKRASFSCSAWSVGGSDPFKYISNLSAQATCVYNGVQDSLVKVYVYAQNLCFRNRANVDTIIVRAKSVPKAPIFRDEYKTHYISMEEAIKKAGEDPPVPDTFFICTLGGYRKAELFFYKDSILNAGKTSVVYPAWLNPIYLNIKEQKNDSSLVELGIWTNSSIQSVGSTELVGFVAKNSCGFGDTSTIVFKSLDTISIANLQIIDYISRYPDYDTVPCEGVKMHLFVENVTADPFYYEFYEPKMVWKLPTDWKFKGSDSGRSPEIIVGPTAGVITAQNKNMCGTSQAISTKYIDPKPYYRVKWEDSTTSPCEDEGVTYSITASNLHYKYLFIFPNDWKTQKTKTNVDTVYLVNGETTIHMNVTVGKDSGYVYVRGYDRDCDDNPSVVRPIHYDSLKVKPRLFPKKAIEVSGFKDTACRSNELQMVVKRDAVDTDSTTHFYWLFPGDDWTTNYISNKGDTVKVAIGNKLLDVDTIGIYTENIKCPAKKGDTLKKTIVVMDTMPLPSMVFDAWHNGTPLTTKPCEGDTLQFYVNKTPAPAIDSIIWTWNGGRTISAGNIGATNWKFYNANTLPDTLSLIAGTTPNFEITVQTYNRCGYNKATPYHLDPTTKIITKPLIKKPYENAPCESADVPYAVDSLNNAGSYVWHYPWAPGKDTIQVNSSRTIKAGLQTGKIWVIPLNGCGAGPNSDTVEITSIDTVAHRPNPLNFAMDMQSKWSSKDTLSDTICLHKAVVFTAKASAADNVAVKFRWKAHTNNIVLAGQAAADSSSVQLTAAATATVGTRALISVAASRASCEGYSKPLYVWVYFVDTVSPASMGKILTNGFEVVVRPCPQSPEEYEVQNNTSRFYKWILPDTTWSFTNGIVPHGAKAAITVGRNPGSVKVVSITDTGHKYCPYESSVLASTLITPRPSITLSGFAPGFRDTVCQNEHVEYHVVPSADAKGYRWIFSPGLINASSDTVFTILPECDVFIKNKSGSVMVSAIDSCLGAPVFGIPIAHPVLVLPKMSMKLKGDMHPCRDSSVLYVVETSGPFAWVKNEVVTPPTNAWVIENINPETGSVDSLKVLYGTGDTVKFHITTTNTYCSLIEQDTTILIIADTMPTLEGYITGWKNPCMGAEHIYNAFNTSAAFDVTFRWEVPANWEIVSGKNENEAVLKIGIYEDRQVEDTIKVYPRGSCGTGEPFLYIVDIDEPEAFDDQVMIDSINPCENTDLHAFLQNTRVEDPDILYRWEISAPWTEAEPIDTASVAVSYIVGQDSAVTISVKRYRKGQTCGWSQSIENPATVLVQRLPLTPRLEQSLHPCKNSSYELSLKKDPYATDYSWNPSIPYIIVPSRRDSIYLPNVRTDTFTVRVQSINVCGSTSRTFSLIPVEALDHITDSIAFTRLCVGDTMTATLKLPPDYLEKAPTFTWTFPQDWEHVYDYMNVSDTTQYVYFIPGRTSGLVTVKATNACKIVDSVYSQQTPYQFFVHISANPVEAQYKGQVTLKVDSVSVGLLGDYEYSWYPASKVVLPVGSTYTEVQTKNLILPKERFILCARETAHVYPEPNCKSFDTVEVQVLNSYHIKVPNMLNFCGTSPIQLYAQGEGGEDTAYFYQWYERLPDSSFMKIQGTIGTSDQPLLDYDGRIKRYFRVIGSNDFVYPTDGGQERYVIYDTSAIISVRSWDSVHTTIIAPYHDVIEAKIGSKIEIQAKVSGGSMDYEHTWYPESGLPIHRNTLSITTRPVFDATVFYIVTVDTVSGCVASDTLTVKLSFDFGDVPNTFTPNGDGINDIFMKGVDLTIIDRRGITIFKSKQKEGWDGRNDKNQDVDQGEYLYIISVTDEMGEEHIKKGVLTISR